MKRKSELFKELGWDDQLIKHFMIEEAESDDKEERELIAEVSDSRSMTVTFSAENSGSNYIVKNSN